MLFIGALTYPLYQHYFSFEFGLDYVIAEFQLYWMNLLKSQLILVVAPSVWVIHWVWKTHERELARYYLIVGALALVSCGKLIALGLFAEAEAARHFACINMEPYSFTRF